MWLVFFIMALIATVVLMFHIALECNHLDKNVNELADAIRKHYESK